MNKYNETFGVDISKNVFDVHGSRIIVSVVNPLSGKRFIQMKLAKVKTGRP
jgi:transposase